MLGFMRAKSTEEYHSITLKDLSKSGIINIARNVGKDAYDIFYDELVKHDDSKPLRIYIETDGGSFLRLQKIMRNLNKRTQKISAYVMKSAHSAGSILSLSCDELYMAEDATLSAIDPQSSEPININNPSWKSIKLIPLIYSSEDKQENRRNIIKYYKDLTEDTYVEVRKILNKRFSEETKDAIMNEMFNKPLTHEKLFFIEDLQALGIVVNTI